MDKRRSKFTHKCNKKYLAKSGVLDIIGSVITTVGSARPGGGAIDKVNRKSIEILVGITE